MSHDISFNCPTCGDHEYSFNITFNLRPMTNATGKLPEGFKALEGKTGAECEPILQALFDELRNDPAKYEALNPSNGWGSYKGLCDVLAKMIAVCREHPNFIYRDWC